MSRRPAETKILDIKYVLVITRFLGKLGISSLAINNPWFNPNFPASNHNQERIFGWGLKESKDYVESKYEYFHAPEPYNPLRDIQQGNIIAEIKATRRFTSMLNKLQIKSADYGLKVCKLYVDRQRARR